MSVIKLTDIGPNTFFCRLLRLLGLVFASIGIAFLLAEFILRAVGFSHPTIYTTDIHTASALYPGGQGQWRFEGDAWVSINSAGMRDDREYSMNKAKGVYRVAVLGDSFSEALQVDVNKTFWRLIEGHLNACGFARGKRVEVLNFGVGGYSTAQELLTLQHRVAPYRLDFVLLAFFSGNDVKDNSKELSGGAPSPYFTLGDDGQLTLDDSFRRDRTFLLRSSWPWRVLQELSNHSRVIQLLNKVKIVVGQSLAVPLDAGGRGAIGLDDHIYLSSPPPPWERAWKLTEALVAEISRETKAMGARFLLVTLTNPIQVPLGPETMRAHAKSLGETDLFYPERRMEVLSRRENIEAIFLAPVFARFTAEKKVYLHGFPNTSLGDGHWNEDGHALAAQVIGDHLCLGKVRINGQWSP